MAEPKTKENKASVAAFLKKVANKARREDCQTVVDMMRDITKEEPKMWGSSIVGFGRFNYKSAGGSEGVWPIAAFSPRKADLTLYFMGGFFESSPELMEQLGKHSTGKSCLYIKNLADVDLKVLRKLVTKSVKEVAPQRIHK